MPTSGIPETLQHLDQWYAGVERAILHAAAAGAALWEDTATATRAYNNDTFATRGSTVAYVATAEGYEEGRVEEAIATAENLNPGSSQVEELDPPPPSTVSIIGTSFTSYNENIELDEAGARAWVAPTTAATQEAITSEFQDAIARAHR